MRIRKQSLVSFVLALFSGVAVVNYRQWHRSADPSVAIAPQRSCSPCPHTFILAHEDFGPDSLGYELGIGHFWNQWKGEAHELPDDVDVKVVVYRGIELEKVRKQFPVIKGKSDYRYLEYARAIQFLELKQKEFESYKKEEEGAANGEPNALNWRDLEEKLKKTHTLIFENLGD